MQKRFFLGCLLAFGCLSSASAQSANAFTSTNTDLTEISIEDLTVFQDEENKVYFVDFQSINMNLNEILVKDADGVIMMRDEVTDLPVNSIYEITPEPNNSSS